MDYGIFTNTKSRNRVVTTFSSHSILVRFPMHFGLGLVALTQIAAPVHAHTRAPRPCVVAANLAAAPPAMR